MVFVNRKENKYSEKAINKKSPQLIHNQER